MMQTMKRGLAWVLVLVMLAAFVPTLILSTSAADVNYVYDGKYIYNWGSRGTVATFLSQNAEDFYEDNNTSYNELSSLSGGTGKSDAPSSALYRELQDLMKSNHDYINGYSANNSLLKYTDCQNGGGKISSFYSGKEIGPSWDSASTWNKEHTWPNSKGLGGSDEDDVMMIRPTSVNENSSRGNTAYGQSSGYYNPNKESNGKYDLRGDVARIFLYVYVRWGNTSSAWGTGGVMESVEVLLAWMEADPVDTWELGRNDSVESITGTRNVFVDYPELAFILFGEEIPADMQTPSGGADKCDHNNFNSGVITAPTCADKGYTLYTCQTAGCGYSYKGNFVAAKGHTYANGVCSVCGEAEPTAPVKPGYATTPEIGKAYKLGLFSIAKDTEYYFTGTMSGYYGATDTAYDNGVDVFVEQASGGYYLYFKDTAGQKQYISLVHVFNNGGEHYNFVYNTAPNSVFTWDTEKYSFKTTVNNQFCYIGTYGTYVTMSVLRTDKLGDNDYYARLYTSNGTSSDTPTDTPPVTPDPSTCQHSYKATVIAPTCTAGGFTTYVCTLCANSYVGDKTAAKGHNYTNGTCTSCGATESTPGTGTSTKVTISFADKANRTEFSDYKQVWVQNGITVTNDKASATSNVADYADPVRFYQGSSVTIAYPGMTKIEIDCTGLEAKYVGSWSSVTDASATNNNGIVTVVFSAPTNSYTFTNLAKQSRAYSITVYTDGSQSSPSTPQACTHTSTTTIGATEATCTTNGFSGKKICTQCNTILDEGKVIEALGHTDANGDKTCDVCGKQTNSSSAGHVYAAWVTVRKATCTEAGLERRDCDHCSEYETREIPATGHNDTDGDNVCDVCEESTHTCKEVSGFKAFLNMIINFFRKLFGQPELCPCGETVLDKKKA